MSECLNDLTKHVHPEARRIIFAQSDLQARFALIDSAAREYNAGNMRGAACLLHAEMYLADRLGYELFPPPTKMAIPIAFPSQHKGFALRPEPQG